MLSAVRTCCEYLSKCMSVSPLVQASMLRDGTHLGAKTVVQPRTPRHGATGLQMRVSVDPAGRKIGVA